MGFEKVLDDVVMMRAYCQGWQDLDFDIVALKQN
jgi:hypothetical protein